MRVVLHYTSAINESVVTYYCISTKFQIEKITIIVLFCSAGEKKAVTDRQIDIHLNDLIMITLVSF